MNETIESRPNIPIDTPIWVRNDEEPEWRRRHFAKWSPDGRIMTYAVGYTSHTSADRPFLRSWNYHSLTDPNKDPEDE